MNAIKEWARGNPVAVSTLLTAIVAAFGFPLAEDKVAALVTGLTYVVTQIVTYHKVTPAKNPEIPQPVVVDPAGDPVEIKANDSTPFQLPPVRAFLGQRRS